MNRKFEFFYSKSQKTFFFGFFAQPDNFRPGPVSACFLRPATEARPAPPLSGPQPNWPLGVQHAKQQAKTAAGAGPTWELGFGPGS